MQTIGPHASRTLPKPTEFPTWDNLRWTTNGYLANSLDKRCVEALAQAIKIVMLAADRLSSDLDICICTGTKYTDCQSVPGHGDRKQTGLLVNNETESAAAFDALQKDC